MLAAAQHVLHALAVALGQGLASIAEQ